MTSLRLLLYIVGAIAAQVGLLLCVVVWRHWRAYRRLKHVGPVVAAPDEMAVPAVEVPGAAGFRPFRVRRRVPEDAAGHVCSFYLEPVDGRPLPEYRPGQFLTFHIDVPESEGGGEKRITRCYSLSDSHRPDHYRISIKRIPPPPNSVFPAGRASNFFHDHVEVGTTLQVRGPSGHFYLEPDDTPIVLIAGGIGITPMLSMLNWCAANQRNREVWFYYGVRNSRDAAFAQHLQRSAAANPDLHLRVCFSDPLPEDRLGREFHFRGRIGIELFKMELPLKPYHFYVCGPAPMMETLVPALEDWGVPDTRIHFEAFGPASVKRRGPQTWTPEQTIASPAAGITVTFSKSGRRVQWSQRFGSLLEFAESHGIAIDSGCRAGSCGTCQTTVRSGEVAYPKTPDYDPQPGTCLMCIGTPGSDVTLEA